MPLYNCRMHFKILLYIALAFLSHSSLNAQNFYRSYGNTDDEVAQGAVETKDSAFFIFGTSSSFLNGTSNFYLMKIDSSGFFQWSKTYGGTGIEQGNAITRKPNGHYLLSGYSNSFGNGGYDILNVEVDSLGNEIWSQSYGGSDWDFAYDNYSLPNGNSIICGSTYSIGNGDQDGFLMMIDNNGDSVWMKAYGESGEDVIRKTIVTSTNEIISIGYITHPNSDKDIYLIKTDINGDTVWTRTYGTTSDDEGFSLVEMPSGHYLMVGYSSGMGAGGKESYYFETDTSGLVMWTQNIGGSLDDEFRDVCLKPSSNRFFTAATTQSYGNGGNEGKGYLLYYPGGYYVQSNNYGTIMEEEFNSLLFSSNKRCLMVGSTNSPYGNKNILAVLSDTLFPTQSNMLNYADVTAISENELSEFSLYPNPANDIIYLSPSGNYEIVMTDLSGKLIAHIQEVENSVNISGLSTGIYLLSVTDSHQKNTKIKLVVTR